MGWGLKPVLSVKKERQWGKYGQAGGEGRKAERRLWTGESQSLHQYRTGGCVSVPG